ncbi:MAG: class I SAM-dependent methyltransferase [Solirubrobacterales bacterium]
MSEAPAIFDRHAAGYEAARRRLIPPYDHFYGTAVGALDLLDPGPDRVLDLGAGTGLLAASVRAAWPQAALTLTDAAGEMLRQARESLGDDNTTYVRADLVDPLPAGPWDAIVSALAIHHLTDADKRGLLARIHAELREGGVFVNAEQVSGPGDLFTAYYEAWHERRARQAGSDDAEWEGAVERMSFDRCADLEAQLRWLRGAGFDDVDCLFKDHRFAVLVARR